MVCSLSLCRSCDVMKLFEVQGLRPQLGFPAGGGWWLSGMGLEKPVWRRAGTKSDAAALPLGFARRRADCECHVGVHVSWRSWYGVPHMGIGFPLSSSFFPSSSWWSDGMNGGLKSNS